MKDEVEKPKEWEVTADRFVAFFDIMGFKDLVGRSSHDDIVKKLTILKNHLTELENENENPFLIELGSPETKSITFSDLIIVFSKQNTMADMIKIIGDAVRIFYCALENGIAIKGALSYGSITVDIKNSLFFGQPIIDAYLLHEQLQMYGIIVDHNFEVLYDSLKHLFPENYVRSLVQYKANLKSSKIEHRLVIPGRRKPLDRQMEFVKRMYSFVSGNPRIYVDNTLNFYDYVIKNKDNPIFH